MNGLASPAARRSATPESASRSRPRIGRPRAGARGRGRGRARTGCRACAGAERAGPGAGVLRRSRAGGSERGRRGARGRAAGRSVVDDPRSDRQSRARRLGGRGCRRRSGGRRRGIGRRPGPATRAPFRNRARTRCSRRSARARDRARSRAAGEATAARHAPGPEPKPALTVVPAPAEPRARAEAGGAPARAGPEAKPDCASSPRRGRSLPGSRSCDAGASSPRRGNGGPCARRPRSSRNSRGPRPRVSALGGRSSRRRTRGRCDTRVRARRARRRLAAAPEAEAAAAGAAEGAVAPGAAAPAVAPPEVAAAPGKAAPRAPSATPKTTRTSRRWEPAPSAPPRARRTTRPGKAGAETAQGASVPDPQKDISSQAADAHVEKMGDQEPGPFDVEKCKGGVKADVEGMAPLAGRRRLRHRRPQGAAALADAGGRACGAGARRDGGAQPAGSRRFHHAGCGDRTLDAVCGRTGHQTAAGRRHPAGQWRDGHSDLPPGTGRRTVRGGPDSRRTPARCWVRRVSSPSPRPSSRTSPRARWYGRIRPRASRHRAARTWSSTSVPARPANDRDGARRRGREA